MNPYYLDSQGLTRSFPAPKGGDPLTVFENVNFGINKGEFVCIIGHSGCGKSTILNILAGLDEATNGVVLMEDKEVKGPSLDRGVVFQNSSGSQRSMPSVSQALERCANDPAFFSQFLPSNGVS